jgi:hypothetical protein
VRHLRLMCFAKRLDMGSKSENPLV